MNDALKSLIAQSAQQRDYSRSEQGRRERKMANKKYLLDVKRCAVKELQARIPKLEGFIAQSREAFVMNMKKSLGENGYAHQLAMKLIFIETLSAKDELAHIRQRVSDLTAYIAKENQYGE